MKYTEAQLAFLRDNYPKFNRKILTEKFNESFGTDKKLAQIVSCLKNHKINSGRTGYFPKGNKSWNQRTKGVMNPNATSFKKGHVPKNAKPVGSERICTKDGYVLIKVPGTNPYTGHNGRYVHKHRWVWEQHHGPIPKGKLVSLKDGNPLNCTLENLELIDRNLLARLNYQKINSNPKELRPVLRTYVKLKNATLQAERQQ
jgi:hypothetical protein